MVCKYSSESGAGRRGLLSATRDPNKPRKKAGWRAWGTGQKGKKKDDRRREEEIEQHRCIVCACWHTEDVLFTAGEGMCPAATAHTSANEGERGKMSHIYLRSSLSKDKWGKTNVLCDISYTLQEIFLIVKMIKDLFSNLWLIVGIL